jgi:broad specificity phosphatase PhoE
MKEPSRLYLVRHGETDLNRDRRFRGMSDAPLNERGRLEVQGAARLLSGLGVSAVYTSPVRRAVETAEIIAGEIGAGVSIKEGLVDVDYGEWQGLTVEEVREKFGEAALEAWIRDPGGFTFPGGESMRDVRSRLEPALLDIVRGNPGGAAAAVSHLAVLKVCFIIMMGVETGWFWKLGLDNGSVSLFSYKEDEGFMLQSWNCLPRGSAG